MTRWECGGCAIKIYQSYYYRWLVGYLREEVHGGGGRQAAEEGAGDGHVRKQPLPAAARGAARGEVGGGRRLCGGGEALEEGGREGVEGRGRGRGEERQEGGGERGGLIGGQGRGVEGRDQRGDGGGVGGEEGGPAAAAERAGALDGVGAARGDGEALGEEGEGLLVVFFQVRVCQFCLHVCVYIYVDVASISRTCCTSPGSCVLEMSCAMGWRQRTRATHSLGGRGLEEEAGSASRGPRMASSSSCVL